jgi:N-acetylmuramoyl-L-alanine amidase
MPNSYSIFHPWFELFMRRTFQFFLILVISLPVATAHADGLQITAINYSNQSGRIGFELSGPSHQRFFTLSNPNRLVIDFLDIHNQPQMAQPPADHPLFTNIRCANRNNKDLRVVVALKADVDVQSAIDKQGGTNQFSLEVTPRLKATASKNVVTAPTLLPASRPETQQVLPVQTTAKPVNLKAVKSKARNIIVAIDAGHGGKDVGAQGNNGTQEKDVVFAIAKHLESLVNNQPGMRAVMIRNGDYFVFLKERVRIAQAAKADLFVSIHADAFNDPDTHGASVYTLANKGASSQSARWLADSENAADLTGGAISTDRDDTLVSVLQDLSQTAAKEASQNIGNKVLKSVKNVGHLHRTAVQKAGFVVLKSPDIPSILVETAFISNPDEERRLNSSAYQEKMAAAVFGGIMAHFKQYAPADTLLAQQGRTSKSARVAVTSTPEPSAQYHLPVELNSHSNADLRS